jgi:hypothetical protein
VVLEMSKAVAELGAVVVPLWMLATIAVLLFLREAATLLIPVVLAVPISYTLEPVVGWLERSRRTRINALPAGRGAPSTQFSIARGAIRIYGLNSLRLAGISAAAALSRAMARWAFQADQRAQAAREMAWRNIEPSAIWRYSQVKSTTAPRFIRRSRYALAISSTVVSAASRTVKGGSGCSSAGPQTCSSRRKSRPPNLPLTVIW